MISDLRENYKKGQLNDDEISNNPFELFQQWLDDAIAKEPLDPTAMVVSTVDEQLQPHSRVVLLKFFDENGFTFFTNYDSHKGKEINFNQKVSLLFHWKNLEKQVRISGVATKTSEQFSEEYFNSRPFESQLGAWASPQSTIIASREVIENNFEQLHEKFSKETISKPKNWGGFTVKPTSIEFWQGRPNRLHDRIYYYFNNSTWNFNRLAP